MTKTLSDERYEELKQAEQERDSLRDELRSFKNEFGNYREAVSKKFNAVQNEIQRVRETDSSGHNPEGSDGENHHTEDENTTLEKIADDDQDNPAGVRVTPSITRAASVMKHWFEWSDKAPKGRNIKTGLRKLIETATGERLVWRQVYRAGKKIEELTKGKIVFIKHDRHGWMLLQPSSARSG